MIQINTVQGGETAFNALLYPPPTQSTLDYFRSNIEQAMQYIGDKSSQYIDMAKSLYDKYNSDAVLNASKAILFGAGQHFNQDMIYPLNYDNMGTANLMMQRYIMAQPDVSVLYNKNMCYGFQNTYLDLEPDNVGPERYDYRRVMDGVVQFDTDTAYVMHYSQNDESEELGYFDKFAVLKTWDEVARLIADDIDPTSPERDGL